MKILLIIFASCCCSFLFGQTSVFRGQIYSDNLKVTGGSVIFPLTNDTLLIGKSGVVEFDLKDSTKRVFYFYWQLRKSKIFRYKDACLDLVHKISVPDKLFYEEYYALKKCPICLKGGNLIPIEYGLSGGKMTPEVKDSSIRLGGCVMYDGNPFWYCTKDKFEF
ncbi:MAG: hypothetical protein ABI402_06115 [Ferruginibacter sp.]